MTEPEWLTGLDPHELLDFLTDRNLASARQFRLFSCACCQLVWHLIGDPASKAAVEAAERFADGLLTDEEREAAFLASLEAWRNMPVGSPKLSANRAAGTAAWLDRRGNHGKLEGAHNVAGDVRQALEPNVWSVEVGGTADAMSRLLRDIIGNPFRPVSFDTAWRTSKVTVIAATIYAERRFADLHILADALEEAGCSSVDLLAHCRQRGEHVRGCWGFGARKTMIEVIERRRKRLWTLARSAGRLEALR